MADTERTPRNDARTVTILRNDAIRIETIMELVIASLTLRSENDPLIGRMKYAQSVMKNGIEASCSFLEQARSIAEKSVNEYLEQHGE